MMCSDVLPHQQQALRMFWGETPQLQHCRGGVFIHPVPLSWRKAPGGDKEGVPMVSGCPTASGHPAPHFTAMPAAVSDSRLLQAAATHPRGLLSHSSLFLNQALRGRTAPPCPSAWKWKTHSSTGGGLPQPPSTLGTAAGCISPLFFPSHPSNGDAQSWPQNNGATGRGGSRCCRGGAGARGGAGWG